MTQTSYNSGNPPPTLYHRCGQPVQVSDRMVGYCLMALLLVDGQAVRYCPRCGKRIWRENLIHPGDLPKLTDAEQEEMREDHLENEDRRFAAQRGVL